MLNVQKIGPRTVLPIILVTVLFSVVLYFMANTAVTRIIENNLRQNAKNKITAITISEKRISRDLLAQAALFSRATAVEEAYQTAYQGDVHSADDPYLEAARKQLFSYFTPIEEGYRKVTGKERLRLHFHLPPARSLLRIWNKKQHKSDDLSSFRHTILTISQAPHTPINGIEIGRGGFALRGIAPVFSPDNRYLGSVEMLSSYEPLVRSAVINDQESMAVYMDQQYLSIARKLQDSSTHPVVGGQYVYVLSTDRNLTDSLLTPELLNQGKNEISFSKNGHYFITMAPIKDFNDKSIGVLVYSYDAAKAYATLASLKHGILLLCLALCAGILIPLFLVVRTVTKSVNGTTAMLKEIAQGKGDLTKRLPEGRKDELGDLARYFNEFLDQIQSIVSRVIDNAGAMNSASNDLTSLAVQMSETADETSSRSAMVATATEEMSSNFNNVAAAMEESSTNLSMVADSSEAMVSTINALASQTDEARAIAAQAVDRAGEATSQMEELGLSAVGIGRVLEAISEISAQVNLLALNATIEAARAGEAGKGFAVVANEIKDLAKQTSDATDEIKEKISGIQHSTDSAGNSIGEISQIITKISDMISSIAGAVDEQSEATTEITTNISQASQGIQEVNVNINQSSEVIGEVSKDISVVNVSAADITRSSSDVKSNAERLNEMAGQLNTIVGSFRV
jgi:methyl-accepting chemotaxis protein